MLVEEYGSERKGALNRTAWRSGGAVAASPHHVFSFGIVGLLLSPESGGEGISAVYFLAKSGR
jgi:hypothetical protein